MNPIDASAPAAVMPDLWITLLKSGIMLCIVLAVLFSVLYWIKRLLSGQSSFHGQGVIKQIASHHLAPKEKVVLLDVLGEKILIGITAQSINCLAKIETGGEVVLAKENNSTGFFTGLLKISSEKMSKT
jgi:flagellar protein FliO/FliZ